MKALIYPLAALVVFGFFAFLIWWENKIKK